MIGLFHELTRAQIPVLPELSQLKAGPNKKPRKTCGA